LIAKSIDTSVDAVRFELDRLRENTKSQTSKFENQESLKKVPIKNREINISSLESSYAFLLAAMEVVDEKMAKRVEESLKTFYRVEELSKPDDSELARLVFTLEQQFDNLPELAVVSEVVSKLNILRTNLLRKAVNESRMLLRQSEEEANDADFTKLLQQITSLEKEMRVPAFFPETFLD
jgi:hypothetical protein